MEDDRRCRRGVQVFGAEIDAVRFEIEGEDAPVLLFAQLAGFSGRHRLHDESSDVGRRLELCFSELRGGWWIERQRELLTSLHNYPQVMSLPPDPPPAQERAGEQPLLLFE